MMRLLYIHYTSAVSSSAVDRSSSKKLELKLDPRPTAEDDSTLHLYWRRIGTIVGLVVLSCSTALYADSVNAIQQGNSNADRIAAQSQANMTQQQQVLAQRLQALSAAMQSQNPTVPIVVQPLPQVQKQPAPVTPPAATQSAPPAVSTPEPNATGLPPSTKNDNGNNNNQWNYGF